MILEWIRIHEIGFWWIGILSMATFVGTLIVIPILVVRIPEDYFKLEKQDPDHYHGKHPVTRLIGLVVKNIIGIIFVLAGLAMLLLPGQGLVTILIGITLMNFPRKYALERHIVQQPTVLRAINWMRAKANRPTLQVSKTGLTVGVVKGEKDCRM